MQLFTQAANAASLAKVYSKVTLPLYERYRNLISRFCKEYSSSSCFLASSPGRVELIGNHTDHNGGFVVACAINLDVIAAFSPRDDGIVSVKSDNYRPIVFSVKDAGIKQSGSNGMVRGVTEYLQSNGYAVGGFNAYLQSQLPVGAGVSSSAAFQLLIATIYNDLYNDDKIDAITLARAGQFAENVYFGKPCGLLDQSAIALGGVVEFNFSSGVAYRQINSASNLSLVLVNTGKSHSSLTDAYAQIPADMKQAAGVFGKDLLCNVAEEEFYANLDVVSEAVGARATGRACHFFEECRRAKQFSHALERGDDQLAVRLINESGKSSRSKLRNCSFRGDRAIIRVMDFVSEHFPGCGVRVHGGGFAGTVLCIVKASEEQEFVKSLSHKFGKTNVIPLSVRLCGATTL